MDCPRCGAPEISGAECPRCGVILARAKPPRPPRPPSSAGPSGGVRRRALVLLLAAVAGVVVARWWLSAPAPPVGPGAPAEPVEEHGSAAEPLPPEWPAGGNGTGDLPPFAFPTAEPEPLPDDTADADRRTAARLAGVLSAGGAVSRADVRAAEELHARYGEPARSLLEAVLVQAAARERAFRRYTEAEAYLRRAALVAPRSPHPPRGLLAVLLEAGDWSAAEAAARTALALAPADPESVRGLAYALLRQDRSHEAVEQLESFLDDHDDAATRAFLEKLRQDAAPESGLTEQRLAHFHVRYDGEAHEDVGRAVLRVLDRHYATLVRTFDHQPEEPIPVILLSRQRYDDATGAPGWSGGLYDSFDGRVRLPIGGLSAALTPQLDGALLHELTHAFVADSSRGVAPREIQEGLAQLLEGKTTEGLVGEDGLRALADGRLRGVAGFYVASLSLVEHLMGQRGQGGVNELLRAMADTGSADEAFRQVYGRDFTGVRRDWASRLRQRHGS